MNWLAVLVLGASIGLHSIEEIEEGAWQMKVGSVEHISPSPRSRLPGKYMSHPKDSGGMLRYTKNLIHGHKYFIPYLR